MRSGVTPGLLAAFALSSGSLLAQTTPSQPDTIKVYRLGEVVVTDGPIDRVTAATVDRVSIERIDATDAVTAAGVAYQIPAARIQTNSRGESLLYLRGAGERQIAIFFDGALINVPWDNRVDLSLVPLNAVGGISVTKGVPSVLYGTNVIGGAVNIASQELRTPGSLTEVELMAGTNSFGSGSVTHLGNVGDFNYLGSVGYFTRDGYTLPDSAALFGSETAPFLYNQADGELRTNSDSRVANLFLRGEYRFSPSVNLGLSLNMIDGAKGVSPEGNVEDARFWRYPEWGNITATLNGDVRFGADDDWSLRGAIWGTKFDQSIASFTGADYQSRASLQEDDDMTLGGRFVLQKQFGRNVLSLALNGLQSTHDQADNSYDSTGALKVAPTLTYQQQIYSVGLEYDYKVTEQLGVTLGGSFDGMSTPKTGDKPAGEGFSDYSLMSGITMQFTEEIGARISAGRKSRFPTMRELYGEALRRFLLNPDLKPEQAQLLELGVEGNYERGNFAVVGFGNITENTIDQENVRDSNNVARRRRINLLGSRSFGVELSGELRAVDALTLTGHFAYIHTRRRSNDDNAPDSTLYLSEKPEIISTVSARYEFPFGLQPELEFAYTGTAYTLNEDNIFVALPTSAVLNARLAYRLILPLTENFASQVFIRVNNITNEVVLPQLGLPAPGREIQGGIKVTF